MGGSASVSTEQALAKKDLDQAEKCSSRARQYVADYDSTTVNAGRSALLLALEWYNEAIHLRQRHKALFTTQSQAALMIDVAECHKRLGDVTESYLYYMSAMGVLEDVIDNFVQRPTIRGGLSVNVEKLTLQGSFRVSSASKLEQKRQVDNTVRQRLGTQLQQYVVVTCELCSLYIGVHRERVELPKEYLGALPLNLAEYMADRAIETVESIEDTRSQLLVPLLHIGAFVQRLKGRITQATLLLQRCLGLELCLIDAADAKRVVTQTRNTLKKIKRHRRYVMAVFAIQRMYRNFKMRRERKRLGTDKPEESEGTFNDTTLSVTTPYGEVNHIAEFTRTTSAINFTSFSQIGTTSAATRVESMARMWQVPTTAADAVLEELDRKNGGESSSSMAEASPVLDGSMSRGNSSRRSSRGSSRRNSADSTKAREDAAVADTLGLGSHRSSLTRLTSPGGLITSPKLSPKHSFRNLEAAAKSLSEDEEEEQAAMANAYAITGLPESFDWGASAEIGRSSSGIPAVRRQLASGE